MATENYLNRIRPRRSLGGYHTSLSLDNRRAYSISSRRLPQHYLYDTNSFTDKAVSSSPSSSVRSPSTPIPTLVVELPSSEQVREQTESITQTSSCSQMSSPHYQSSIDLMASTLKCDDCQTHGGLFQCCHCNQRLCIRCCNKHYKNVTVELERLHELSDRLVAKIVHTKNDLERQKNETLEQCHKWRLDTINTINKAHTLIIQTIHDEYETLGKEYELFVQKEMQHIHIDQNELLRMRKGNLSSVLSSPSSSSSPSPSSCSSTIESKNSIDTIRKRIEAFAKNIDETGKFLFQVKLPSFDIDDNLRVESRFGDATRSTSATWQSGGDLLSSSLSDRSIQEDESLTDDVQSAETDIPSSNNKNDIIININDNSEKESNKIDEQELDIECQTTNSSSLSSSFQCERNNSNPTSPPSSRYALSVENDIELQQQQFYSPRLLGDRFDSAYCTAPSSPSNLQQNHYFSTSSLHEQPSTKCSYASKNEFGSFYNNRRHTHAFQRAHSPHLPTPPSSSSSSNFHNNNNKNKSNDNEDTYRSVQHVQLKREQDGSLEGIAIQVEQRHNTEGMMERRHTCMQACGVRRRTTIISPRSPTSSTSNTDGFSYDQPWLYYRANSTPSFTQ
ncbi:unnamed protein product [Rotaria socialis]|uniref:B box-type domain-containing protein n=2 Tax=Rotaria socialis TaxID=392032 RepID=A0A820C312_9BILA|nr:unnamed protein product [Rotaria socialis]CAF4217151.1 unnamed protein product [Rotaria socialis]